MAGCYTCGGTGECPTCHGAGATLTQKCVTCGGLGGCPACNPNRNVAWESGTVGYELRRMAKIALFALLPLLYWLWKVYVVGR